MDSENEKEDGAEVTANELAKLNAELNSLTPVAGITSHAAGLDSAALKSSLG